MSESSPRDALERAEENINEKLNLLAAVGDEVGKVIVGQKQVVEELLISLLAGGHCLLEGVPGLAKTMMVSTLAKALELDFHRVQFTPDLMPSDIVGTEILEEDHASGKRFFKFQKGPVFTNILLADEINRTPPKTQAALLEAMQEKSVSYGGKTYSLPEPFFVLATQNPVEQSGTYPLPEAQLDRFLMFIRVDYPSEAEELEILKRTTGNRKVELERLLNADTLVELQKMTRSVEISDSLLAYIANLVRNTRPQSTVIDQVKDFVRWGAGPRAGQALVLCAKAKALLAKRYSVTLDDIAFVAPAVFRHRVLLNFQAEAERLSCDQVVSTLLDGIAKPKSKL
ncbi:MoxR family ATPase [Aliikangiella sp. G2MR2-5]|uniref:AAA family ATPase n=1 Tax=Aliikangiella sp. G2MR2-5 TaxID=2788943 RepID=UPI0018A8FE5A|nr:MoxR family ATPase [Aliikangiella sp. G2MR2-5]